jgi:hypothetical protein
VKRLLLVTIFTVAILTLLIAVMRAAGTKATTPPVAVQVLGLSDCDSPCWHGIMPGKTTFDEAATLLKNEQGFITDVTIAENNMRLCGTLSNLPSWSICATPGRGSDTTIKLITLRSFESSDIKLGDALLLLGTPTAIWPCGVGSRARIGIYFSNDVELWAFDDHVTGRARITPDLPVRQILFHYPGEDLPYAFDLARWHGLQTFPPETTCPTMP